MNVCMAELVVEDKGRQQFFESFEPGFWAQPRLREIEVWGRIVKERQCHTTSRYTYLWVRV